MYALMRWPEVYLVLFVFALQTYRWASGSVPFAGGIGVHAAQWTAQRKLDARYVVFFAIILFQLAAEWLASVTKFVTFGTMGIITT